MRYRNPTWLLLATLTTLAMTAQAQAQARGNQATTRSGLPQPLNITPLKNVDERLFLVYTLEHYYRTTWPAVADTSYLSTLQSSVAQRALMVDQIHNHLVKQKLDIELREQFQEYRDLLALQRSLPDGSARIYAKHHDAYEARVTELDLKLQAESDKMGREALLSGLEYGARSYLEEGKSGQEAIKRGLGGVVSSVLGNYPKFRELNDARRQTVDAAYQKFQLAYAAEVNEYTSAFLKGFDAIVATQRAQFRRRAATLMARYKWSDGDLAAARPSILENGDSTSLHRNPFPLLEGRGWSGSLPENRTVERLLGYSAACIEAARTVPKGPVYDIFRAALLGKAGRLANQAAAEQIGTAGFLGAPVEAGKIAMRAWVTYLRLEPIDRDIDDRVRHEVVRAFGYGGNKIMAYQVALQASSSAPGHAAFWYDCARLCGIVGDIGNSLFCLRKSVDLGFKDFEEARVNPDLRKVRTQSPQEFERILRGEEKSGSGWFGAFTISGGGRP